MQRTCLNEFIAPADYPQFKTKFHSMRYYFDVKHEKDNVCLWRGVRCEGSIVRGIAVDKAAHPGKLDSIIQINWLAPSLHHVVIREMCVLDNWEIENIPREARLFALICCRTRNWAKLIHKEMNFNALPSKIEEFYVYMYRSFWIRNIVITNVPTSLRKLHITNYNFQSAKVEIESLPKGLVAMSFGPSYSHERKGMKVRAIGKVRSDPRVSIECEWAAMIKDTKYEEELKRPDILK